MSTKTTYEQYLISQLKNSVMYKQPLNIHVKTLQNMLKASVSVEKNKVVIDNNSIIQTIISIVDVLFVQQRIHDQEQNKLIDEANQSNLSATNQLQQIERQIVGIFSRAEFQPDVQQNMTLQLLQFEELICQQQNDLKQLQLENQSYKNEVTSAQNQIQQLVAEQEQLQSNISQISQENYHLKNNLSKLQNEHLASSKQLEQYSYAYEALQILKAEHDQVLEAKQYALQEIGLVQCELQHSHYELLQIKESLNISESNNEIFQEQLQKQKYAYNLLTEQLTSLNAKYEELQKKSSESLNICDRLQQFLTNNQYSDINLSQNLQLFESNYNKHQQTVINLQSELQTAQADLIQKRNQFEQYKAKNDLQNKQTEDTRKKMQKLYDAQIKQHKKDMQVFEQILGRGELIETPE
ncbi:Hypothetical_protein [Hexamita inflata]|uniref:Hypothetical_protein n=1 Tax=Hexamita inflata TaxID=28002 RepID=A0AA86P6Y4_9EUKA|nr:Hypothetical protein HINF_LOCUS20734 [Hexamita inflata]